MAGGPVALGLMVASSLYQAHEQQKGLNQAAAADDVNAQHSLLAGSLQEEQVRRQERAVSGEAIAAEAGNGVAVGTGSALDLLFQNARAREYAVLTRRYDAAGQADAYANKAAQERKAAKGAMFGGLLRAGAQAVTGIGEMNNASALAGASGRLQAAQLPGGSAMPLPSGSYGF